MGTWSEKFEAIFVKTFADVDVSRVATANFTGDGNAVDRILTMSNHVVDSGWVQSGVSTLVTTQDFDYIELSAHAFYDQATDAAEQRISPELQIRMTVAGVATVLQTASTGYQRHISEHNNSSNSIPVTIRNVPTGARFQVIGQEGSSSQTGIVDVTTGTFSAKGINKVSVRTN